VGIPKCVGDVQNVSRCKNHIGGFSGGVGSPPQVAAVGRRAVPSTGRVVSGDGTDLSDRSSGNWAVPYGAGFLLAVRQERSVRVVSPLWRGWAPA